jgi:hypothetical protein
MLQDLSELDLGSLVEHAFLTLKKNDNNYNCWFAVSLHSGNTPNSVREFAERIGARLDTRGHGNEIFVNRLNSNAHRLHILNAGQIMTEEVAFSRLAVSRHATSMVVPDLKTE